MAARPVPAPGAGLLPVRPCYRDGHRQKGDRAGHRRHGPGPAGSVRGGRPDAQLRPLHGRRPFPPATDQHPSSEPGGLVQLHHRHGSGRARNLRLHPPRPGHPVPLPVHLPQPGRRLRPVSGVLENAALGGPGDAPAQGQRLLGNPRAPPNARHHTAGARQLSAGRRVRPAALRHGNPRSSGDLRRLLLLHPGSRASLRRDLRGEGHSPDGSQPEFPGPNHGAAQSLQDGCRPGLGELSGNRRSREPGGADRDRRPPVSA